MSILNIKNNIKTLLDELVTAGTIAGATITDIRKSPLAADIPNFPHAFLMPPSSEDFTSDNRTNQRTYNFDIMILVNAENLSGTSDVETMIEGVLNKFANDPTLGGTALAGALPVSSSPEPFQHNGKDMIMAIVTIQAKELVTLTF